MKQVLLLEKYPIYTLELSKSETHCESINEILAHFKTMIAGNPVVQFIAIFDHYPHTTTLPDGFVNPKIKDAKHILFCFGKEIQDPGVLAIRPRSIGITELEHSYVITFLEAPNPTANASMETWAKALIKTKDLAKT